MGVLVPVALAGLAAVVLPLVPALVAPGVAVPYRAGPGAVQVAAQQGQELAALPVAVRGPVSAAVGNGDRAYWVRGLVAVNAAQQLRVRFTTAGPEVSSGRAQLSLALAGVGRAGAMRGVARVAPRVAGNRVSYPRGLVQEWYVNGPLGLEQGFTIGQRPRGGAGPLLLSLAMSGRLRPRLAGGAVVFAGGRALVSYGGVSAVDARGRGVHAWLGLAGGRLLVAVDDRGAAYPLRIDPLIQQGEKLVGTGSGPRRGWSVALSGDGNTALIGAEGGAWVFTRSGGTWTQQGEKLVGTGDVNHSGTGDSVALSEDGNTALIGDPDDNGSTGAAWVFTRSGGTWTQQGPKLVGSGADGTAEQGWSVALAGDGNTALIGGPGDGVAHGTLTGAAWVFTRSGGTWTQQGGKLAGSGAVGSSGQGQSVALSGDGNTALIGGDADNLFVGAAWVFTRSGTHWTQQGPKLVGPGGGAAGWSVALSGDGNTALIGGPLNGGSGAAWVFTRSGGTWTQQGAKLAGSGAVGSSSQGWGVALSGDGNTALIGGPGDNHGLGAAWVFTRSGGTWTQQGSKLAGSGAIGSSGQGQSVALAGDGNTALIGGPGDNGSAGAAWVFATPPGAPTIGHAAAGDSAARVTFTAPAHDGGANVTSYTATATDITDPAVKDQTATGPGSPLTVTGLTNGDKYTFTVTATNTIGTGPASAASNPVTPNPLVYVANQNSNSVTEYAIGADGNAYPFTTIQGDHTGIDRPTAVALTAAGDLWVVSQGSNSVTEYASGADGNASPVATIQGDHTGIDHPWGLAVTFDGDLCVVNNNNSVTEYASGADGNLSPVATIQGDHTGLNGAYGVAVTPDGNLWVANSGSNSLTEYASGADGNAPPIATIQGDRTGLREPVNVALDAAGNVFVTNAATKHGVPSLTEYASGADGNASPIATISGSAADLYQPVGLAVDPAGHIFVSEPGGLVKEFAKGTTGDTAPIATIIGDHTGLNEPISVAVAGAAP